MKLVCVPPSCLGIDPGCICLPFALPLESDEFGGPCDVLGVHIEEMILKSGVFPAVFIEATTFHCCQVAVAVLGKLAGAEIHG